MTEAKADIGLIGLAVMGQNLILNMNDHGFTVAAFNRTVSKVDDFLANEAKGTKIVGAHSIQELMGCLKKPRRVVLLVKAGQAVDDFIEQILPHTEEGDIIIDGGNSNFGDSIRRTKYLEEKKRLFIGTGVSGGEEGARHGPSIMPGGSAAAWPHVKDILQAISAKAGADEPCCQWVGATGSGHYVKMVHNGIEYGDMQLICEAYHLMKDALGMSCDEMGDVFTEWNKGELDSYLIEITAQILKFKDADGTPLVEKIRDTAGQKGTGKWTGIEALEQGMPVTLIGEAVFARCLSALKEQREYASTVLADGDYAIKKLTCSAAERATFIEAIRQALLASKIVSYAQVRIVCGAAPRLPIRTHTHPTRPSRAVCIPSLVLSGFHADAGGGQDVRLDTQLRRDLPDVARRMHHPLHLPRQHQGGARTFHALPNHSMREEAAQTTSPALIFICPT